MKWKDGFIVALISGSIGYLLHGYLSLGGKEVPLINGLWVVLSFLVGLFAGSDILGFIRDYLKARKEKLERERDKERIYNWLYNETKRQTYIPFKWCSTEEIADATDLTDERVRTLCPNEKIVKMREHDACRLGDPLPYAPLEERWAIKEFVRKSYVPVRK